MGLQSGEKKKKGRIFKIEEILARNRLVPKAAKIDGPGMRAGGWIRDLAQNSGQSGTRCWRGSRAREPHQPARRNPIVGRFSMRTLAACRERTWRTRDW